MVLKYLDESGFSLCLPPAYSWTRKGRANQHRVRTRWGKQGRINLIGSLRFECGKERLEYGLVEGSCRTREVIGYLDALAEEAEREGKPVVVVLTGRPSTEQVRCASGGRGGRPRGSACTTCRRTART